MWKTNKQLHETENGRFLELLANQVVETLSVRVVRVSRNLWPTGNLVLNPKKWGNNCGKSNLRELKKNAVVYLSQMELDALKKNSSPSSTFYHLGDFGNNLFIDLYLLIKSTYFCCFRKLLGRSQKMVYTGLPFVDSGYFCLASIFAIFTSKRPLLFPSFLGSTAPILHTICEHVTFVWPVRTQVSPVPIKQCRT